MAQEADEGARLRALAEKLHSVGPERSTQDLLAKVAFAFELAHLDHHKKEQELETKVKELERLLEEKAKAVKAREAKIKEQEATIEGQKAQQQEQASRLAQEQAKVARYEARMRSILGIVNSTSNSVPGNHNESFNINHTGTTTSTTLAAAGPSTGTPSPRVGEKRPAEDDATGGQVKR